MNSRRYQTTPKRSPKPKPRRRDAAGRDIGQLRRIKLQRLLAEGIVSPARLARRLNTTAATIRRDLVRLASGQAMFTDMAEVAPAPRAGRLIKPDSLMPRATDKRAT